MASFTALLPSTSPLHTLRRSTRPTTRSLALPHLHPDFSQELRCFQTVTCYQAIVNNLDDAHEQIDNAISTALKESKPVYISVSCNLPAIPYPTFSREPVPFSLAPRLSNQIGLEAAVEATMAFLNKAVKPVLMGGPKIHVAKAGEAFVDLAEASGYPVAVMPSAKGLVPEHLERFICRCIPVFWADF